jgi:DNA-binding transcriptional LysR family regulator
VASLSINIQNELLATGRFLTVLPGFMLRVTPRNLALKALPVALPNSPMPIGLVTLKNRTLTPLAQLFIENVRALAKPLAKS